MFVLGRFRIGAMRLIAIRPRESEGRGGMSEETSYIAIPHCAYATMADALQHSVIDKGASKTTRKAAFSALVALVNVGLLRDTSTNSQAQNGVATPRRGCAPKD